MNTRAKMISKTASFVACGFALYVTAAAGAAAATSPATRPATRPAKPPAQNAPQSPAPKPPATPQTFTLHVFGLFQPDREADLRAALTETPGVELKSIDFDRAEGTFTIDPTAFPGTKPDKLGERLDQVLRQATNSTFSLKPRSETPREKLKRVEVTVAPLDCKACALAVHDIVYKVDGVEQVAVDMKTGRISALVDAEKVDRAKLEAALKAREVTVRKEP